MSRSYLKIYKKYLQTLLFSRHISFVKFKRVRDANVNYPSFSRECRIILRTRAHRRVFLWCFYHSRLLQGPSLRSGKCHCRFHRAIRNWQPGFVTSNWRRRHSECTCGTMNSDPPTTTIHDDYDNEHDTTRIRGEGAFREARGRMGPSSRSKRERERMWYHHTGTSAGKATRISYGDIDIAINKVLLRVTNTAWQQRKNARSILRIRDWMDWLIKFESVKMQIDKWRNVQVVFLKK